MESNRILNDQYVKLEVVDEEGKKIATITHGEVTVAKGYTVVLKPKTN